MKTWEKFDKCEMYDGGSWGGYHKKVTKIEQHKLDIIEELRGMSVLSCVVHFRKYYKLRDQLNNHQKHFPELYL